LSIVTGIRILEIAFFISRVNIVMLMFVFVDVDVVVVVMVVPCTHFGCGTRLEWDSQFR
jgi:hypothetical protein